MHRILLVDNYDSFTYNLFHLIQKNYSGEVIVKRDFEIDDDELLNYDAVIISPGPGRPETTPKVMDILGRVWSDVPILGICLGMQCINEFFAGKTVRATRPIHGKTSTFNHIGNSTLFDGIPENIDIARYHSLVIDPSKNINITGYTTDDRAIMSIEHKTLPIYGLQFHPESFLNQYGDEIIINFLNMVGLNG